jgi:hypothetical protein
MITLKLSGVPLMELLTIAFVQALAVNVTEFAENAVRVQPLGAAVLAENVVAVHPVPVHPPLRRIRT